MMTRRTVKSSKQPSGHGQPPPSPSQITRPLPSTSPESTYFTPTLPNQSSPSTPNSTQFPPQTPVQKGDIRPDDHHVGAQPSPGAESAYTPGGSGFSSLSQASHGARSRQAGYYDGSHEVFSFPTAHQQPHPDPLPPPSRRVSGHGHARSIAQVPTQPQSQWRKQGLRPSTSVMSLSLMRKVSASTDGGGETTVTPSSSFGQASPTMPLTPMSAISGESDESRSAPGAGGMTASSSMRHFLLKPGSWFGMGKGKGKQKEEIPTSHLLQPPEKRAARGGSSRPEAVMGLGLGMSETGAMDQLSLIGSVDRERYPTIASPGTPERRRAESLAPSNRRSPGKRDGMSPGSPLASDFAIQLSPSLKTSATVTGRLGGSPLQHRPALPVMDLAGGYPSTSPDLPTTSPNIPEIRLAASQPFTFKTQPLSPPSVEHEIPRALRRGDVQTSTSRHAKTPSPEPYVSPMDSQESVALPRPSGDLLRGGAGGGGGGLLAASRKPWSKSVDDLGRLFGRAPRVKAEVVLTDPPAAEINSPLAKDQDVAVAPAAIKRMSWNAKQMLRDVSARDQAEKGERESHAINRTSGAFLPGGRKKTQSFSGMRGSTGGLNLLGDLPDGQVSAESNDEQSHYRAAKMSSPPTFSMRSGPGGLSSSSSSPMLSTFAEAGLGDLTGEIAATKSVTPLRDEMPTPQNEARTRAHGRTVSGSNLLMMPFLRHKHAAPVQSIGPPPTPGGRATENLRNGSLTPSVNPKRLSQIVHMEGFVMRYSGGALDLVKTDDYFRNAYAQQSKGWKPYRMLLKGNILHLYKPSPEQKMAMEGAFPVEHKGPGKPLAIPPHQATPPNTIRGKRAKPVKPTLAIPIAASKAEVVQNPTRPYLFSLVTDEGAKHVLQATSESEMNTWIFNLKKTSEEAVLRRKTYLPPMGVRELKRESMTSVVDHRSVVFGVDLTTLLEQENASAGADEVVLIPWIAEACMTEIESRADETGLYRLTGALNDRKRLQEALDNGRRVDLSVAGQYPDINTITGVFKAWMSSLPDPVICSGVYYEVISAMRIPEWEPRTLAVREVLRQLPRSHFDLLHRILSHLERLLEHEDENRMTPYNLAMCLAPSMLRAPIGVDAIFSDLGPACKLIMELMQYHREILGEAGDIPDMGGSAPPSPAIPSEEVAEAG